jgi:hypothetical protein
MESAMGSTLAALRSLKGHVYDQIQHLSLLKEILYSTNKAFHEHVGLL